MSINKVGVVGAGTMGASIAVSLASHGYAVTVKDVDQNILNNALSKIDKIFLSLMKKGMTQEEVESKKSNIKFTLDYQDMVDMDLVIEAVLEKIKVKKEVFQSLENVCRDDCILATNTSSLSVSEIASGLKFSHRVLGMHFFNPAHLMKLVEIVPGLDTSEKYVHESIKFAQSLDKLAVRVEECASFLVNRLLGRYMNESLWCLAENIVSIEELDKLAADFVVPIGPLSLRDMNGADIGLAVSEFNYDEYGERFRPAPILDLMVKRNWLGQKTGKGFYLYDSDTRKKIGVNTELWQLITEFPKSNKHKSEQFKIERLFLAMINEAFIVLQEKICRTEDLDPALMAGLGMRKGPLSIAQSMGLDTCLAEIEHLFSIHGERFRPAPLLKKFVRAGRKDIIEYRTLANGSSELVIVS